MSFSSALRLTDLDDFITPSQACIKPILDAKAASSTSSPSSSSSSSSPLVRIHKEKSDRDQDTYEGNVPDGSLPAAKITLSDCLACSGCVTSAEAVLVSSQSAEEFLRRRDDAKGTIRDPDGTTHVTYREHLVVSISPQSVASMAAYFAIEDRTLVFRKLLGLFRLYGAVAAIDVSWCREIAVAECIEEFLERFESQPTLHSSCPGWVCYAEKTHGSWILPYLSQVKSPQAIAGVVAKRFLRQQLGLPENDRIFHVSVMPCFDKKLEASRAEMILNDEPLVDLVLSTLEMVELLENSGKEFSDVDPVTLPFELLHCDRNGNLLPGIGGGSGGYAERVLREAYHRLSGSSLPMGSIDFRTLRNPDMKECKIELPNGRVLRFAKVYGFRNIQNLVRKMKQGNAPYDFCEVLACPSGCLNGGAQLRPPSGTTISRKQFFETVETIYSVENPSSDPSQVLEPDLPCHARTCMSSLPSSVADLFLDRFGEEPWSSTFRSFLRTTFHDVPKVDVSDVPILARW